MRDKESIASTILEGRRLSREYKPVAILQDFISAIMRKV